MKKTVFGHLLSVALVGSLLLSGCQKEKTGFLRLNAERLTSNEKTYVDSTTVQWLVGDSVRVNGIEYELVNDNTISGDLIEDDHLLAIYPSSISNAQALSEGRVMVTIPSEYTYQTVDIGGGTMKQKLAMPMVGVAEGSATSMTMRHLCSAMEVTVTNRFSEELVLDSIILRGSGLSGNSTVTFNDNVPAPGAGTVNSVRMAFSGTTIAANGGTLKVQIPVLPVTSGTTWVSVRGHLATSRTAYRYERSTDTPLARAWVYRAPVTMTTPAEGNHVIPEGALSGVFSVSATKRVFFSKGNLRATTTNLGTNWTWSFAEHQYDYIGDAAANTSINGNGTVSTNGTVDFFGWSTSSTYYGINSSTSDGDYSGNTCLDWGAAMGGGWRTLTDAEWAYLINTNTRTTPSGVLYAKANVNSVPGLIILPDDWSTTYYTLNSPNTIGADYTTNIIDLSTWTSSLEAHGAVFLPAAGYRHGTYVFGAGSSGFYWSSTLYGSFGYISAAYSLRFSASSLYAGSNLNCFSGCSVRLVQDYTN